MKQTEALKLALEALIEVRDANIHGLTLTQDYHKAINGIKAALEAKDEIVEWKMGASGIGGTGVIVQPQRTWAGLMRGVRVDGDIVVITVKNGNDAARELCGALIEEMNK